MQVEHNPRLGAALLMLAHRNVQLRTLKNRDNNAVHQAADKHLSTIHVVASYAFMKARKAIRAKLKSAKTKTEALSAVAPAREIVRRAILEAMPGALVKVAIAGGEAGVSEIKKKLRSASNPNHDEKGHFSSGDNPMAGEKPGEHTPAAQARVIEYLKKETGEDFKAHGSVSRGETSKNDMDIVLKDSTAGMTDRQKEDYEDRQSDIANKMESDVHDRVTRGEITQEQGMQELYGDFKDPTHEALSKIGFEPKGGAEWLGIRTTRFENEKTGHTIEIWQKHEDDSFYGLRSASPRTLAPFNMRFDVSNPETSKWAKEHALELADGIADTTMEDLRQAIADAMEGDGLDEMYDSILEAVGSEVRAELIARTETMTAANKGNRESWDQAVDAGLLDSNAKVEWIATPDCCDECADLDGETRSLDGQYPADGGDGPPLHPNCRCTEGIAADDGN